MEILNTVGSVASIISLFVALYVANRVNKIDKSITTNGNDNITAGRDARVSK